MALRPVSVEERTGTAQERQQAFDADVADQKAHPEKWGGVRGEGGPPTLVEQAVRQAKRELNRQADPEPAADAPPKLKVR